MVFDWNGKECGISGTEVCCKSETEELECKQADEFITGSVEEEGFEDWAPEVACLADVPAGPEQFHEEGSALNHTAMVAREALRIRGGSENMFLAALSHDLGKCDTPESEHPNHRGHAEEGVDNAERLAEAMNVSGEKRRVMKESARYHMRVYDVPDMRESKVIRMVNDLQGLSTEQLVDLAEADKKGRKPVQSLDKEGIGGRFEAAESVSEEFGREDAFREFDADEGNVDDIVLQERVRRLKAVED